MRYHTEGEVSVIMATKLSSVPMVTENLTPGPKSTEGRHRRDRKRRAEYGMYEIMQLSFLRDGGIVGILIFILLLEPQH